MGPWPWALGRFDASVPQPPTSQVPTVCRAGRRGRGLIHPEAGSPLSPHPASHQPEAPSASSVLHICAREQPYPQGVPPPRHDVGSSTGLGLAYAQAAILVYHEVMRARVPDELICSITKPPATVEVAPFAGTDV
ncbi:hypothetical protein NDU88_002249 [Pleurodeles waltl]|uniref:Uncharacterized protein n=1 Tax=Pleurodeles waltl TaxID=8319 RepID=A0AAV7VA06_PLEWA|nr:hypothetical protein NDU88_002249 [Pleurodeles waltl]